MTTSLYPTTPRDDDTAYRIAFASERVFRSPDGAVRVFFPKAMLVVKLMPPATTPGFSVKYWRGDIVRTIASWKTKESTVPLTSDERSRIIYALRDFLSARPRYVAAFVEFGSSPASVEGRDHD